VNFFCNVNFIHKKFQIKSWGGGIFLTNEINQKRLIFKASLVCSGEQVGLSKFGCSGNQIKKKNC
jgi:hypothetical protein